MQIGFLDELKNINGTKDKISKLTEMVEGDVNVARYFYMALNPFVNFGVRVLPNFEKSTDVWSVDTIFEKLSEVSHLNHSNKSIELVKEILSHSEDDDAIGRLILKNPNCGISVANFNKVIASLGEKYREYLVMDYPCMLVSGDTDKVMDKFNWDEGVIAQTKMDGMRFNAIVSNNGSVEFYGRSGKPITIESSDFREAFRTLAKGAMDYEELVFDGELLVEKDGKILDRKTGNGILNKAVRGTISEEESEQIVAVLWDEIPKDLFLNQNYDMYRYEEMEYENRFKRLTSRDVDTRKIRFVETTTVYSKGQALDRYHEMISQGEEGIVLKSKHNYWQDTRVTDCVKLKEIKDCDLKVVGYQEGTGKYAGMLGALLCESSDGKLKVSVGSGFSDEERKTIKPRAIIDRIVTVQYNMTICDKNTGVYSLFLPRFVESRDLEKLTADSTKKILNN